MQGILSIMKQAATRNQKVLVIHEKMVRTPKASLKDANTARPSDRVVRLGGPVARFIGAILGV
jgi:hypothetical protein